MAFCSPLPLPLHVPRLVRKATTSRRPVRACAENGLLVVGAGDLGARVARLWRERHAEAPIVCATATPKRHKSLRAAGYTATLATDLREPAENVVFCAPPGQPDISEYAGVVRAAANLARRRFVMTSTTAVLAPGHLVHENSRIADTPRAEGLAAAENAAVRSRFGLVIRLAGLYSLERGAHQYWCRTGKVAAGPDGVLRLLHYDDAASVVVTAISADHDVVAGQRFIATDGTPVSRKQIIDAAREHPMYAGFDMPTFGEGGASKRLNNNWSKARLGWEPRYKSFVEFMREETRLATATGVHSSA